MARWARLGGRRSAAFCVALVLLCAAGTHGQEGIPPRRLGIRWQGSVPQLTFSARDLVNQEVRKKLRSGLPQTIELQVLALEKSKKPVAVTARSCRVVYDLWEDVYRVQILTPRKDRSVLVRSLDDVLDRCVVARRLQIGRAQEWEGRTGHQVHFAVLVEFNPMSQHTVERIRRWLARPTGGRGFEGDAFFGSFVSLFVNRRLGDAERVIRFRSQPIAVP